VKKIKAKKVSESAFDKCPREIFPKDLNPHGTVFGGYIQYEADKLAGLVAQRHSKQTCVTLGFDDGRFPAPAYLGETLLFDIAVNRAWNTSMEIGVKVWAADFKKDKMRHMMSWYTTFVALDDRGRKNKSIKVPDVIPETPDEKRRYQEAEPRRIERLRKEKERREKEAKRQKEMF